MFKDREKLYQAYHSLLSMALTMALVLGVNQYYELRVHILLCALFSVVISTLVFIFNNNRRNTIAYLIVLSIIPVTGLFFWIRKINMLNWIKDVYNWCMEYNGSEELYVTRHAYFMIFLVTLVSAILFFILVKRHISKIILAALIFAMFIYFSVQDIYINKVIIGIGLFYILSILVEYIGKIYIKRTGKEDKKAGILYLAPVCLLLAILSVTFPSKPEPIQWQGVKNVYNNIKNMIDNLILNWDLFGGGGPDVFGISMSGYSENGGDLGGGSLSKSDKIALFISGRENEKPVYLIGSVSDVYTGSRWDKSGLGIIPGETEHLLDYTELMMSLSRVDMEILDNKRLVDRRIITLDYDYIRTKTLFYPLKTSWINIKKSKSDPNSEATNILFEKNEGEDTNYVLFYYDMNLKGEALQEYLKELDSFSYDETMEIEYSAIDYLERKIFNFDNQPSIMNRPEIYEVLKNRADIIKEQYINLPEELPDRVRDLAYDITKDYKTDYEKLKAIESFLSTYEYSLSPGKMPEGRDFVDFFLFDSKKGYCTAYATAMAVLGRCIGVPTRYVEGFLADYDESGYTSMQPIRNSDAHAWAEAYIEGFGWVPFEATASYYDSRYITWPEYVKRDDSNINIYQPVVPPTIQPPNILPNVMLPNKSAEKVTNAIIGVVIAVSTIVIVLILITIYYNVMKHKYNKRYSRADFSGKMYLDFLRILRLLRYEGYLIDQQETVLMFAQRLKDTYKYEDMIFLEVAKIFMKYRYAEADITEMEYESVNKFYIGLKNKHKEDIGRLRLIIEEFLYLMQKSYS